RRWRPAKALYGLKPVSRVRIPPSPPNKNGLLVGPFLFGARVEGSFEPSGSSTRSCRIKVRPSSNSIGTNSFRQRLTFSGAADQGYDGCQSLRSFVAFCGPIFIWRESGGLIRTLWFVNAFVPNQSQAFFQLDRHELV